MQQYQQPARHCRAMSPCSGSNMQQHQATQIGNSSDRQQHQHCTISNATSLNTWQYTTQAKCSSVQQDQQAARYCTVMPSCCNTHMYVQQPATASSSGNSSSSSSSSSSSRPLPAWHRAQSADQLGPSAVSPAHLHASKSAPARLRKAV